MTQRRPPLHSPLLRRAAQGRACTLRLPGYCVGSTDTTVLAHLYWGPKATGGKGDDLIACYACAGCHAALDGYRISREERYEAMGRALAETLQLVLDAGLIEIHDAPEGKPMLVLSQRELARRSRPPTRKVRTVGGGQKLRQSPTATPAKIAAQKAGL